MMEEPAKVDLETPDIAAVNREALAGLFPGVLADGVLDVAKLATLLDVSVAQIPDGRERYGLQWAGKQDAARSLLTSSRGTLIPNVGGSVGFDSAENVFIEGENLEVLKLLQKAYNDCVKVIYIDPPYNTGKDFVYNDDFQDGLRAYLEYSGQVDQDGNRLSAHSETTGRRHSRWISMMFPRLVLARNLLTQDGVIFVSIDDNEVAQLRLLFDEVFGPENFVENYIWESNFRPDNSSSVERENSQHILCYARNKQNLARLVGGQKKSEGLPSLTKNSMAVSTIELQPDWVDFGLPDGDYGPGDQGSGYILEDRVSIRGGQATGPFRLSGRLIWSQRYLNDQAIVGTRIVIKSAGFVPYSKKAETSPLPPTSLIARDDVGDVLAGNAELRAIFGSVPFNHPKPTSLIRYLVKAVTWDDKNALVLDFFAGSGSTAHAVALLNASDGGGRKTISVNLPEPVPAGSVAESMGFKVVSDISVDRIRRVMNSDAFLSAQGLRQFTLAPSNFQSELGASEGALFDLSEFTLATQATDWDAIAAEVLLKEGVPLHVPWVRHTVKQALIVVANGVAVVLSKEVDSELANAALALKPRVAVFLEDGFAGADAVKANAFTNSKNANITMKTV